MKRLQDAAARFSAGDAKGALLAVKKALKSDANNVDALNLAGHASARLGDLGLAVKYWRKASALAPSDADLANNLGVASLQLNRFEDATRAFEKAVALQPNNGDTAYNLGLAQAQVGQLVNAKNTLEAIVAAVPNHVGAQLNLGNVLHEMGQYETALGHFRKALELQPSNAALHLSHAQALRALNRFEAAKKALVSAQKRFPNDAAVWADLAMVEQDLGNAEAAVHCTKKAVALDPNVAAFWNQLGFVEQQLGDTDAARDHYHKALERDPKHGRAFLGLSHIAMTAKEEEMALRALKTVSGHELSAECHIRFALASALDARSEAQAAFDQYERANALKAIEEPFDEDGQRAIFRGLKEAYAQPSDRTVVVREEETKTATPVFIVGMPRSGTSLVEQILASHSQVYGAGERLWMSQAVAENAAAPQNATPEEWRRVRQSYLQEVAKQTDQHAFVTDKLPTNFLQIGAIRRALPEAVIIHCRRDPVDTCLSNFKQLFGPGLAFAYDLKALGTYYGLYRDLMDHWMKCGDGDIFEIEYEQLVSDQRCETEALLKHLGLPWEDACLSFHKTKREVRTASSQQVRKPIYSSSVKSWEKYGERLAPLFNALGPYAPE